MDVVVMLIVDNCGSEEPVSAGDGVPPAVLPGSAAFCFVCLPVPGTVPVMVSAWLTRPGITRAAGSLLEVLMRSRRRSAAGSARPATTCGFDRLHPAGVPRPAPARHAVL